MHFLTHSNLGEGDRAAAAAARWGWVEGGGGWCLVSGADTHPHRVGRMRVGRWGQRGGEGGCLRQRGQRWGRGRRRRGGREPTNEVNGGGKRRPTTAVEKEGEGRRRGEGGCGRRRGWRWGRG